MICASISPIVRFRQSRTPSHNRRFILPTVTSVHRHRHHRYYESIRLLVSHHSGFPVRVVIPSLPLSRTIRDLPRSPNQPFVFIPTLSRHASPLWESPVYGAAITYGKSVPIEASNFPNVEEGRRLAYPTTGSLLLRAKDSLRLFRFPLARDTLPLLASSPIRVNSAGGILTLWLIKLRGTVPANPERV